MTTKTRVEKLHFSIDGGFLTEVCRDLWCEGEIDKALNILTSAFGDNITESQRYEVLTGKLRFEGVDRCRLVADNATKSRHGAPLPSVRDLLAQLKERGQALTDQLRVANSPLVRVLGSPWGVVEVPESLTKTVVGSTGSPTPACILDWDEFEERFPGLVQDAITAQDRRRRLDKHLRNSPNGAAAQIETLKRIPADALAEVKLSGDAINREVSRRLSLRLPITMDPRLAAVTEAILAPALEAPPKPDPEMRSANGWLSNAGVFLPCGFMGHAAICAALNLDEATMERTWVKIQDSYDSRAPVTRPQYPGSDFAHVPKRGVTQRQFDAMALWCQRHGRELPPDLEVR